MSSLSCLLLLFGHSLFRRWCRSSLLALHGIEKRYVFLFSAPQVSAWGPCFRGVDLFPPSWNGGFHLWRYLGVLSVNCFDRWCLPDSRALGAGLPGLLGSLFSYCLRHVQVVAATAAPPVLHTLRQPGFPRKLWLLVCRRWLQLRILSGRSPLGSSLCSVSISPSSPSTLVASGAAARELASHFFPFSFSFGVLVTPGFMVRELQGIFPSGCFLFQLCCCPTSALAVGARVAVSCGPICPSGRLLGACSRLCSSPLPLPGVVTTFRYACLGLRPCGKYL